MIVDLKYQGPQLVSIEGETAKLSRFLGIGYQDAYDLTTRNWRGINRLYRNRPEYMGLVAEVGTAVAAVVTGIKSISAAIKGTDSKSNLRSAIKAAYADLAKKILEQKGIVLPPFERAFDTSGNVTTELKTIIQTYQDKEAVSNAQITQSSILTKDNKNIAALAVLPLLAIAAYSLLKKR